MGRIGPIAAGVIIAACALTVIFLLTSTGPLTRSSWHRGAPAVNPAGQR